MFLNIQTAFIEFGIQQFQSLPSQTKNICICHNTQIIGTDAINTTFYLKGQNKTI